MNSLEVRGERGGDDFYISRVLWLPILAVVRGAIYMLAVANNCLLCITTIVPPLWCFTCSSFILDSFDSLTVEGMKCIYLSVVCRSIGSVAYDLYSIAEKHGRESALEVSELLLVL